MIPHMTPLAGSQGELEAMSQTPGEDGYVGHQLQPHERGQDGTTRLVYLNCNTFPSTTQHPGNEEIRHLLDNTSANIAALVEMNVNWKQVSSQNCLENCTLEWWDSSRWSYSYNKQTQTTAKSLAGGTAVLTISDTTARVWSSNHNDPTGLGRWTGTRYRGRGQRHIMVIAAYRPHDHTSPSTVAGQHSTYLANQGDARDPQTAFLQDLTKFIK
jgi:hypothetical protein